MRTIAKAALGVAVVALAASVGLAQQPPRPVHADHALTAAKTIGIAANAIHGGTASGGRSPHSRHSSTPLQ